MVANTKIEWADHTINFWLGCSKVSPACDHCYAESWAKRAGFPNLWQGDRRRTSDATWKTLAKMDKAARAAGRTETVFAMSLGDIWDNEADPVWRSDAFDAMRETPNLIYLLLSKRIGNALKMAPEAGDLPPNCALGATVVNQEECDRDIPKLLDAVAKLGAMFNFVSIEPMLGPVDLTRVEIIPTSFDARGNIKRSGIRLDALKGKSFESGMDYHSDWDGEGNPPTTPPPRLDWIICGGESGAGARPMHPQWARDLRDQCAAAGVPFFMKQWGEHLPLGQHLPDYGLVTGATAVKPGWMKLHSERKVAFAERGVDFEAFRDGSLTFRVGKKRAGRLLDGAEHNEFPKEIGR